MPGIALPTGLTISSTGLLSGTDTNAADVGHTFSGSVDASNGIGNDAIETYSITVNPNPLLNVAAPASVSLNENGSLVFSSANGNAIVITDGSAGTKVEQLSLAVTHGTLTLPSTSGLSVTSGANGSPSITVKGTLVRLNSALNGLKFTPATGYSGSAALTVTYEDLGNNQTASATTAISVVVPASQPTVKLLAPLPLAVPGEPVPLLILVSDTNAAAQAVAFNLTLSFGDGTTKNVTAKSPLLVNHIFTHPGTFRVTVTATDEFGHSSAPASVTIKVLLVTLEPFPLKKNETALFVGGTSGNDTVIFAAAGTNTIAVTLDGVNEGVYSTTGPLIVFGQGGKDVVKESPGLKNTVDLLESPTADNLEADLDDQAIQWAGVSAAVNVLNS